MASVALEEARGFVDRRAKSGNDGKPDGGGRVEEARLYFIPFSFLFFIFLFGFENVEDQFICKRWRWKELEVVWT